MVCANSVFLLFSLGILSIRIPAKRQDTSISDPEILCTHEQITLKMAAINFPGKFYVSPTSFIKQIEINQIIENFGNKHK